MGRLMMLVYVSTISSEMPETDIEALLTEIRPKNEKKNISGLLLYCHGTFMQYVEGYEDNLEELFQSIKNDPRHHDVTQIIKKPIHAREFDSWSMGYSMISKTVLDELLQANWLENDVNKNKGILLLRNFWKNNTF